MSNSYYNHGTTPAPNSPGSSAAIRNEFDSISTGFSKLPTLSLAGANKFVALNSGGTAMTLVNSISGFTGIDNTPIGATTPSTGAFTNLTANGTVNLGSSVTISGGSLNGVTIGASTASTGAFTTVSASGGFTGNLTGAVTGNVTGNLTGNVTGNVTAGSGTSTFNNLTINGTLDMNAGTAGTITGLADPTNASDAANKNYVDNGLALKLNLAGGTLTGALAMSNNKITGLGAPTSNADAATKQYVDTQDALKLNLSGGTLTGELAMSNNKISGLATPTNSSDAATKAYVDTTAQGLDAKASVRVATTANITLSGLQTIDGVTVSGGDRVLVKDQTTASQNGIYVAGSGGWSRTSDADTWDELVAAFTFVEQGSTQANNGYLCTIPAGGTLGSTAVTWVQFSGAGQIDAGAGLTKTGNQLNVGTASSSRIVVNANDIDLATTGVSASTYRSVTVDAYGRVTGGTNPTTIAGYAITDAYTKTEVDNALALKLNLTGGTLSGNLSLGTNRITNLGAPSGSSDAATKGYVDTFSLLKVGGTMSGAIAMGNNKVTGLATPTDNGDAVNLLYVTTLYGSTASAADSAAAAANSASQAGTFATNSSNSATASANSAAAAAATYDAFDDRYLGSKSSDPTVDNDGNALIEGALYWNTTVKRMKIYDGSAWQFAYLPANYVPQTSGTGSAAVPTGTQAQRDGTPSAGYFRFNTDISKFEGYNGTGWGSVGGGATGGGGDEIFIENGQTVTQDYTITAGKNAGSFGPVAIASGVTVTIPDGSVWTIV